MSLLRTVEIEETTAPPRPRRGLLPFSGWHLLLMPVALLFALPLVQMVLTSFMTDAEINSFPPKFIPSSINLGGYQQFLTDSLAPRWMVNTVIVAARDVKIPGRDELTARAANIEERYGLPARKWLRMVRPLSRQKRAYHQFLANCDGLRFLHKLI